MTRRMLANFLVTLLILCVSAGARSEDSNFWMAGFWGATSDEDKSPLDVMEFRKDGTWANYGHKCGRYAESRFHVFEGDIYVKLEHPKGPIAIVFHPSFGKRKLTYTSPRTRNNAVYERLAGNPCKNQG